MAGRASIQVPGFWDLAGQDDPVPVPEAVPRCRNPRTDGGFCGNGAGWPAPAVFRERVILGGIAPDAAANRAEFPVHISQARAQLQHRFEVRRLDEQ